MSDIRLVGSHLPLAASIKMHMSAGSLLGAWRSRRKCETLLIPSTASSCPWTTKAYIKGQKAPAQNVSKFTCVVQMRLVSGTQEGGPGGLERSRKSSWRRQVLTCPLNESFLLGGEMEGGCSKGRVLKVTQSVRVSAARLTGSCTGKPGWVWALEAQGTGPSSSGNGKP